MTVVSLAAIVLGVLIAAGGFAWYGPWSLPAILGGIALACVGGIWLCALAVSKGWEEH